MIKPKKPRCRKHESENVESPVTCRHCAKQIEAVECSACSGGGVADNTIDDCPKCNGSGISRWRSLQP